MLLELKYCDKHTKMFNTNKGMFISVYLKYLNRHKHIEKIL